MQAETRPDEFTCTEASLPVAANGDGPQSQKSGRGRKTIGESQAKMIRARLVAWQQIPEEQRPSLRTLGAELGTSHQLLSFYLKGINEWQRKDYQRRAEAIRDRVEAENRYMTPREESEMKALAQAAFVCMIDSAIQPMLERLEREAKKAHLSKQKLKVISLLAQRGVPIAKKIIEKYKNNLPARQAR